MGWFDENLIFQLFFTEGSKFESHSPKTFSCRVKKVKKVTVLLWLVKLKYGISNRHSFMTVWKVFFITLAKKNCSQIWYLPRNCIFDTGGSCIFLTKEFKNLNYLIAFLNSILSTYIIDCLNPTVNTQVGDLQRIPFVKPPQLLEDNISVLAGENIIIKKTA